MTTWLITGCSTGLGRNLAEAVLATGDNVVVTARDPAKVADIGTKYPDTALVLPLDVTNSGQIESALRESLERFGSVDVLVNNAGYGFRGAIEEGDADDIRSLFATNFFGMVSMIDAVLPGMRERRAGTIVNIASIGVQMRPAGSGFYTATKSAVEGMSGSLSKELEPLGIRVIIVEPGAFRTDFSGRSLAESSREIADYADTAGKMRKSKDTMDGTQPNDPAKGAEAIIVAVRSTEPPATLVLGEDALKASRTVLEARRVELDAWEHVSRSTTFSS